MAQARSASTRRKPARSRIPADGDPAGPEPTAAVVLCGGRGTRMGSSRTHKVCFPLDGEPAVCRLIETLRAAGIERVVVVVGAMAGAVVETIGGRFADVLFVYQQEQLGTGHAARLGVEALQRLGHRGPILLTPGDKWIQPQVLTRLHQRFAASRADMVFVTGPKTDGSTAGRVLTDRTGRVVAVVERSELDRARLLGELAACARHKTRLRPSELLEIGLKHIQPVEKLQRAVGELFGLMQGERAVSAASLRRRLGPNSGRLVIGATAYSPEQIEQASSMVNLSVYLCRAEPLYQMLPRLRNDNAQNEYYLTDLVGMMAQATDARGRRRFLLEPLPVETPYEVMAFNSPDELLAIEDYLRRRRTRRTVAGRALDKRLFKPAGQWLTAFDRFERPLQKRLETLYGRDDALLADRCEAVRRVLRLFVRRYGPDRPAAIVRAPGRINLMGRHVDHRGGFVNVMAIDREIVMVASPRDDDLVRLVNTDTRAFPARQFRISALISAIDWDDWLSYVNSRLVQQMVLASAGDWSNYVKAAVLRLQQRYADLRLRGMDCAVTGNVPMAAGLSSSSAVVVAAAHAAVAVNRLQVEASQFVDLCGEGEWFVGSRGGHADHAAIRFGRRGSVAHVGFFPFRVDRLVELPPDCRVVVADSRIQAAKSAGARDRFNERVACYELAFLLLKKRCPQVAGLLEHVRDINPARLNCSVADIYALLGRVPLRASRKQIEAELGPEHGQQLERIFATHARRRSYALRGVLLYGVAECERSRIAIELLARNDLVGFGRLMNVSHDGDRVATSVDIAPGRASRRPKRHGARGRLVPFDASPTDRYLADRIADLHSEDPARVASAQLHHVPGCYACSTPQIDRMVDLAGTVPGVFGAQLAGAGLGGCIMILARTEAVPALRRRLVRDYYRPNHLAPALHVCRPVEGSGVLRL